MGPKVTWKTPYKALSASFLIVRERLPKFSVSEMTPVIFLPSLTKIKQKVKCLLFKNSEDTLGFF